MAETVRHAVLALVLTGLLIYQAAALLAVLRSRRALRVQRAPQFMDLVWVALPVAVVLILAVRSWIVAVDLASPAMAGVEVAQTKTR